MGSPVTPVESVKIGELIMVKRTFKMANQSKISAGSVVKVLPPKSRTVGKITVCRDGFEKNPIEMSYTFFVPFGPREICSCANKACACVYEDYQKSKIFADQLKSPVYSSQVEGQPYLASATLQRHLLALASALNINIFDNLLFWSGTGTAIAQAYAESETPSRFTLEMLVSFLESRYPNLPFAAWQTFGPSGYWGNQYECVHGFWYPMSVALAHLATGVVKILVPLVQATGEFDGSSTCLQSVELPILLANTPRFISQIAVYTTDVERVGFDGTEALDPHEAVARATQWSQIWSFIHPTVDTGSIAKTEAMPNSSVRSVFF